MNKTIIVTLILFQSAVYAQTDSLQVNGEIGVRGKWQTGNFAQFVINPNGRITLEKKRTRLEIQANYEFLKVNQGNLINDFWSYGLYQYHSDKTIFPMALTHYGFSQAFAIDESLIGGLGAGLNLIQQSKQYYVQINTFVGYLNLKYENTPVHRASSVGSYMKLKFPLKKDVIYCLFDSHAFVSLRNGAYHSFNGRLIFLFQIVQKLGLNMTYNLVYNNNNPLVLEKTNGKLIFGLNYTFN